MLYDSEGKVKKSRKKKEGKGKKGRAQYVVFPRGHPPQY
jgi:hypothetical protein